MALVMMEGFDHMSAVATLLSKGWGANNQNSMSFTTGRFGGQCLHSTDGIRLWSKGLPSTYSTLTVGCALLVGGLQTGFDFITLQGGGTSIFRISLNASQKLIVRNSGGTTIATGTTTIAANTWYYIELKAVVGTSGTCELHLNGVSEIASTVGNFGTTNLDTFGLTFQGNGVPESIDDIYVCDTSGSVNTTFLGDSRIVTIYPNGAGAHTQWTPDSGSNFARVDEATGTFPDGDVSYVFDSTVGDIDTYTMGDIDAGAIVAGVQVNLYARKDDVSTRQIANVIRQAGSDNAGATSTLASTYLYYSQIYNQDPTGSNWTAANVNGDEFGVKLIT